MIAIRVLTLVGEAFDADHHIDSVFGSNGEVGVERGSVGSFDELWSRFRMIVGTCRRNENRESREHSWNAVSLHVFKYVGLFSLFNIMEAWNHFRHGEGPLGIDYASDILTMQNPCQYYTILMAIRHL